jgi:hypothetical protein
VDISTQPVRLAARRHGRSESAPLSSPSGGSATFASQPLMQDRPSASVQRNLLAWRAAQDEVA